MPGATLIGGLVGGFIILGLWLAMMAALAVSMWVVGTIVFIGWSVLKTIFGLDPPKQEE